MPAIPGFAPPVKALCVAPSGLEEGSTVELPDDELGLVVMNCLMGWQYFGKDPAFADLKYQETRQLIRRDRNHPSIIIWNSCINHSGGNKQLIAAATEEDPTRARGQDTVPCPMNFKHKTITGNGALCIEHTGHTFDTERGAIGKPGKAAVGWVYGQSTDNREYELTRRHWEHTDAAYKVPGNSGLAGGGTGDACIMLAQQLIDRRCPGEVVYLDLSTASRQICEARAKARGLRNIQFLTGSLLDLPTMNIGPRLCCVDTHWAMSTRRVLPACRCAATFPPCWAVPIKARCRWPMWSVRYDSRV